MPAMPSTQRKAAAGKACHLIQPIRQLSSQGAPHAAHHTAKRSTHLDDAVWDVHLAAQSWEPDDDLMVREGGGAGTVCHDSWGGYESSGSEVARKNNLRALKLRRTSHWKWQVGKHFVNTIGVGSAHSKRVCHRANQCLQEPSPNSCQGATEVAMESAFS